MNEEELKKELKEKFRWKREKIEGLEELIEEVKKNMKKKSEKIIKITERGLNE